MVVGKNFQHPLCIFQVLLRSGRIYKRKKSPQHNFCPTHKVLGSEGCSLVWRGPNVCCGIMVKSITEDSLAGLSRSPSLSPSLSVIVFPMVGLWPVNSLGWPICCSIFHQMCLHSSQPVRACDTCQWCMTRKHSCDAYNPLCCVVPGLAYILPFPWAPVTSLIVWNWKLKGMSFLFSSSNS